MKKSVIILAASLALAACSSDTPRVIQASSDAPDIHLTSGLATQIEMPSSMHVQSVVTGNPNLVTADKGEGVVNLVPKDGTGETNLIVRATDDDGHAKVYQYRVYVQGN